MVRLNLVPRPSHCPVFCLLAVHKNRGGERLVHFLIFYHVNDISVYLGRQSEGGGGRDPRLKRTHFVHFFFGFEPEAVQFLLHERRNSSAWES